MLLRSVVDFQRTTRRYVPEVSDLRTYTGYNRLYFRLRKVMKYIRP
jgi:hypothetical protein